MLDPLATSIPVYGRSRLYFKCEQENASLERDRDDIKYTLALPVERVNNKSIISTKIKFHYLNTEVDDFYNEEDVYFLVAMGKSNDYIVYPKNYEVSTKPQTIELEVKPLSINHGGEDIFQIVILAYKSFSKEFPLTEFLESSNEKLVKLSNRSLKSTTPFILKPHSYRWMTTPVKLKDFKPIYLSLIIAPILKNKWFVSYSLVNDGRLVLIINNPTHETIVIPKNKRLCRILLVNRKLSIHQTMDKYVHQYYDEISREMRSKYIYNSLHAKYKWKRDILPLTAYDIFITKLYQHVDFKCFYTNR